MMKKRGQKGYKVQLTEQANQEKEPDFQALQQSLGALDKRMQHIATQMERTQIAEYVDLLNRPFKLMWRNLLAGTARGVGIAIGFTFFAATIVYVLQILGALNLPIIGDYIADIVRIVQMQLDVKSY
ncbi:DUF5665 domain-containing protein [Paenibacillus sp. J5C_2022]|nr:DUF5665 domain-containing protein [Paenibacillus sp. J5C2022]MCU6709451.1 DUF5665 domain-containing protein [Paenibacillus sp. J5C2022]